jgi:intracellular multiplication protein IcmJ
MVLFPLTLGVRPSSGAGAASVSQLKSITEKAQKRDDGVCRFCGFQARQFQRVIPWAEAGDPPFATVCIFCESCLSLERNGVTGAGLLLWLPEISQVALNHIVRAVYAARTEKGPMAALATRALDALTVRRSEAKKRLGSDDPLLLATILKESLDPDDVKASAAKLEGIRLLPSEKYIVRGPKGDANQLPRLAKYWLSPAGPYGAWPTDKWQETFKKALAATGNA